MNKKNLFLALIGIMGAEYIGYPLLDKLILFNMLLIVGVVSEILFFKNITSINLANPLLESLLDVNDVKMIIHDNQEYIFTYYYVEHLPDNYQSQNLHYLTYFKLQILELNDDVFLRHLFKVPNQCNDRDLFLKEKSRRFLGTMKNLIPGLKLLPITTSQLIWILDFKFNEYFK